MGPEERSITRIMRTMHEEEEKAIAERALNQVAEIEALISKESIETVIAESAVEFATAMGTGYEIEQDQKLGILSLFRLSRELDRYHNRRVKHVWHKPIDRRAKRGLRSYKEFRGAFSAYAFDLHDEAEDLHGAYRFRHSWRFISNAPPGQSIQDILDGDLIDLDIYRRTEMATNQPDKKAASEIVFHIRTWGAHQLADFAAFQNGQPLSEIEMEGQSSKEYALGLIQMARDNLEAHLSTKRR